MTDLVIPAALNLARIAFRYVGQIGASRGDYSGIVQTTGYGGDRVAASLEFSLQGGSTTTGKSRRAQLRAFLMALRGSLNRVYLTDDSSPRNGAFVTSELFSNTDFSSTTGWSAGGGAALSVSNGSIRITSGLAAASIGISQTVTLAAYTPYVLRSVFSAGKGFSGPFGPFMSDSASVNFSSNLSSTRGYLVASGVSTAAGAAASNYPGIFNVSTGMLPGDYVDLRFASYSQCALADSGGNLWARSDDFSNAAWTPSGATVTANTDIAPDGTVTMGSLVENAANSQHYVGQPFVVTSSAQDIMIAVVAAANTRNFIVLQMQEGTSATIVEQYFNVSGTGAVAVNGTTGANWSNRRAFVRNLGTNRNLCILIARKTNAATAIAGYVMGASADGTKSYVGNSSAAVALWRGTTWPTGVPSHLIQSVASAIAVTTQSGSSIEVKGLPVSTTGLLLLGDWVEIDGQLKMVTASLDSDAAGFGYLQFSPPLKAAISDNTPIIIHKPMGRFMLPPGDSAGWDNEPGLISSASLELEEAFGS